VCSYLWLNRENLRKIGGFFAFRFSGLCRTFVRRRAPKNKICILLDSPKQLVDNFIDKLKD